MLQAYIRWLSCRRHKPYKNTRLLGNPNEIVGHAPAPKRKQAAFSRAAFGKYERKEKLRKRFFVVVIFLILIPIIWIAWESFFALGLFQG